MAVECNVNLRVLTMLNQRSLSLSLSLPNWDGRSPTHEEGEIGSSCVSPYTAAVGGRSGF